MQFLYQRDLNPTSELADLSVFYKLRGLSPSARKFCDVLVRGVLDHRGEIDEILSECAENYQINRISAVDRNVLRLGIFEMLHCSDVPAAVAINEGIEIAKKYSTEESGKFVNGVLDRVRKRIARPATT